MATVSILEPVSKEAELRKKEALTHWKAIQQSGPLVSTNSLTDWVSRSGFET